MTKTVEVVEQLVLVEVVKKPAKRSARQQFILDGVERGGIDGLYADEAGALLCERRGRHDREQRCQWCAINGKAVLKELEAKGLAIKQRGKKHDPDRWFTPAAIEELAAQLPRGMTDHIPF